MRRKLLLGLLIAGLIVCVAAGPYNPPIPPKPQIYPGAGVPNSTGSAWSTSYTVGAAANNLVQLNGSGQLPAVSGALLTNLPSGLAYPGAGVPNSTGSAWGTSYAVGTAANNLVQLNGSGQLPAVSGALLTNLPAGMVYPGAGIGVSTGSAWGTSLTAPASAIVGISDTQTLSNKSFGSGMTWPTFNQNTAGTAANLSGTPTLPSGTTLVAPVLGTPASGNLANCTFPTLNQSTTGAAGSVTGKTFPASGLIVGTTDSQTLSNKSFGSGMTWPTLNQNTTGTAAGAALWGLYGTIAGPTAARTYTFPDAAATMLYSGGALGTPSGGTLTNCTFPTLNQNTTGTAANLSGTPTLPSGTTLVAPVLGTPASGALGSCTTTTQSPGNNSTSLADTAYVDRQAPLTGTLSGPSATTYYPSSNGLSGGTQINYFTVTAIANNFTLTAPVGTWTQGQPLTIALIDAGTAKTVTLDSNYAGVGFTISTITTEGNANKIIYLKCLYNGLSYGSHSSATWDVVDVAVQ
ncbi:MAG: hypothetical protein ACLPT6_13270 [Desulfobaccales bacterium]